jgi:hypothetical protein
MDSRFSRFRQSVHTSRNCPRSENFEGSEKCYLEDSCCTIASDFSTWASGERPSSLEESVAIILWSLPITKVVRSMKSWSITVPRTSACPGLMAVVVRL